MILNLFRIGLAVIALWSTSLLAHHSVAGEFDTSQRVAMQVEVVEHHFINPHPYMLVRLVDEGERTLTLDMDNAREFVRLGIGQETFQPGDRLNVLVNPSYTSNNTYYLNTLEHLRLAFKYVTNVRELYPITSKQTGLTEDE